MDHRGTPAGGLENGGFILVSRTGRYLFLISLAIMILMISSSSVFAASTVVNSKKYTHPAFFKTSLYRLFHGVDVSVWQGDINWKKSKADGIDFAIIRCGYTALNKFTLHQDSTFVKNYNKAKEAGVSVGIYYYACATTTAEAKKEANYIISILKNNNIDSQLPVVMDYETNSGRPNTVYKKLVKKKGKAYARKRYTKNAKAFMNTLRASGYESMFYSYRMMIDPKLSANYRFNMEDINGSSQYRFWLAQYSTSNSYSGNMEIWQFSSTGKVKGMSGNIDRNFWYYPLSGVKTISGTKSIRGCKVKLSSSQYKYDGKIKQPSVAVTDGDEKLKNGRDYAVSYMNNIEKGTATVLVHGKGNYSNETYSTFKIGDKNVGTDKETIVDEEEVSTDPAPLTGVKTKYNYSKGRMNITWDKSANSTRYQVVYKINNAEKMTRVCTDTTTYTIMGLKPGNIIEMLVRGQKVDGEKVINGEYSKRFYLYFGGTTAESKVLEDNKIRTEWTECKDTTKTGGHLEYKVTLNCVDISQKTDYTKRTYKVHKAKNRYVYNISVRPVYILNDKKYAGQYAPDTHVYVIYGKIKSITSIKGGFKVTYPKTTGIGDPRYKITYSLNKDLSDAKSATRAQDKTRCTVKKLKRGKKYYVAMQTYKKLHGITYYGVMSPTVKVKTK